MTNQHSTVPPLRSADPPCLLQPVTPRARQTKIGCRRYCRHPRDQRNQIRSGVGVVRVQNFIFSSPPPPTMGCGTQKRLAWALFVINPCVLSANRVIFFCFINFPILPPPPSTPAIFGPLKRRNGRSDATSSTSSICPLRTMPYRSCFWCEVILSSSLRFK